LLLFLWSKFHNPKILFSFINLDITIHKSNLVSLVHKRMNDLNMMKVIKYADFSLACCFLHFLVCFFISKKTQTDQNIHNVFVDCIIFSANIYPFNVWLYYLCLLNIKFNLINYNNLHNIMVLNPGSDRPVRLETNHVFVSTLPKNWCVLKQAQNR